MKIILSIRQLLEAQPALQKLANLPFSAATSLRIGRIILRLNPEFENANKEKLKIFRKYGEEKDGKIDATGHEEELVRDLEPLFAEKISVDVDPLELWMLDGTKELTPSDMISLIPLIREKEGNKEKPHAATDRNVRPIKEQRG